jgi:nitrite reductase/ring-hydroxylating ferredoxin subunit
VIVDVGAVDDYEEGSVTLVRAGGREIGIVRWRDEVYAVSNVCAHMRGPLCRDAQRPLVRVGAGDDGAR